MILSTPNPMKKIKTHVNLAGYWDFPLNRTVLQLIKYLYQFTKQLGG